MLIQNYSFYLYRVLTDGLMSLTGVIAIVLLIGAFVAFSKLPKFQWTAFWVLLTVGLVCFFTAFYSAEYEFEEQPELIVLETLPSGEPDCGTAWTPWIKGAYGMGNPCENGCFRGNVLRKKLKLEGFPPWPMYKRELQCWKR